tara:strand:+ start:219 stop:563 length:345 start_codon:yes stop_codon:yes gene_type:complete
LSLFKVIVNSFDAKDVNAFIGLLHEDFVMVSHQTKTEIPRAQWIEIITGMYEGMKIGSMEFSKNRCIFENEKILVMHQIGKFSDGTKEAILVAHILKEGKIMKTETGATPIEWD